MDNEKDTRMQEKDTRDIREILDSPDPEVGSCILETIDIPVGQITPNDWNPNKMTEDEYEALKDFIRERGITGALQVVPISESDDMYRIIDGEHRWRAARDFNIKELRCDVLDPKKLDEDQQKFSTIAYQTIHGKLDGELFRRLYDDLQNRWSRDLIQKQMHFAKQKEFQKIIGDVRAGLPSKEARKRFDSAEIKTMENLTEVLNKIYADYGKTVPYHFLIFAYGKKQHLMVICSPNLWKKIRKITNECELKNKDVNEIFSKLIETNYSLALKNQGSQKDTEEEKGEEE